MVGLFYWSRSLPRSAFCAWTSNSEFSISPQWQWPMDTCLHFEFLWHSFAHLAPKVLAQCPGMCGKKVNICHHESRKHMKADQSRWKQTLKAVSFWSWGPGLVWINPFKTYSIARAITLGVLDYATQWQFLFHFWNIVRAFHQRVRWRRRSRWNPIDWTEHVYFAKLRVPGESPRHHGWLRTCCARSEDWGQTEKKNRFSRDFRETLKATIYTYLLTVVDWLKNTYIKLI